MAITRPFQVFENGVTLEDLRKQPWQMLVAILGTTISPYLFFWQATPEVEEERAAGRNTLGQRKGATKQELRIRKFAVNSGEGDRCPDNRRHVCRRGDAVGLTRSCILSRAHECGLFEVWQHAKAITVCSVPSETTAPIS